MTRQVIDTNVLLFFLQDDLRLPEEAARRIENPRYQSLVSMASLWEISIKTSVGTHCFSPGEADDFPETLDTLGFELLPIRWPAIRRAAKRPWHHRDPFDRLILAEAMTLNAPILSTDVRLDAYGVERVGE